MRYRICHTTDVQEGEMRQYHLGETEVLIIKLDGRIHGLAGRCTHAGAPLADGILEGHILTCPWHGSQFNITDGSVVRGPAAEMLKRYEVLVEHNDVFINEPEDADGALKSFLSASIDL